MVILTFLYVRIFNLHSVLSYPYGLQPHYFSQYTLIKCCRHECIKCWWFFLQIWIGGFVSTENMKLCAREKNQNKFVQKTINAN